MERICKMLAHRLAFVPGVMALLIGVAGPLGAQYRGSLQGAVKDPSGGVVADATVTLTSSETNVAKTATTSSSGIYTFPGLAPGLYSLTVEKEGFAKQSLLVNLTSEQAQSQDVQLQLAQAAATAVTVSAEAVPAIDTETATISGTLSGQQVENLPTFGRDPFQAAILAPGTFGDNARSSNGSGAQNLPGSAGPGAPSSTNSVFQTENQVQIVANGTRNNSNSFQIDGTEVNSLAWGGAAVVTPNEESVKEVTVQANPYSAENGRNSGAQVLVVSKNGTNEFHGSALFKATRPGLDAFQRWNGPSVPSPVQKDTDRFNQWAGSIGGPVIKNHLFFFFSYETLRNSSASLNQAWFETPQFDSSAASAGSIASKITGYPGEGASFNLIIPMTCAQAGFTNPAQCRTIFSNGAYQGLDIGSPLKGVPLGTMDPTYGAAATPFGVGGGLDGVPDVILVQSVNPTNQAPQQFNGRMDFQATAKDLIAFSTYYVPNNSTFFNGPARAANFWHSDRLNYTGTLLWDHTISPTWLNEARGGITRWWFNEVASNPQEPWGLPQDNIDNMAGVNPFQFFGAPGPGIFYQTTYNFRDTASTTFGNHSLKLGTDLYWEQDNDAEAFAARPSYNFHNLWDFANDAPYAESGNFNPLTGQPTSATKYIRSNIYAFFVQDDWKIKPNLTLNLGLRWEYFTPVHEKYGNISNVLLGPSPDPLLGLRIKVGGDLYHASKNNWGPQVGFAWRPNPNSERFVLRGGFGIGYNRMEEAITLNGRANPPLVISPSFTGSQILYQVPANVHQFSGWPINPFAIQTFDPATGLPTSGAPVTINGFPENLKTPLVYRYSLDTETNVGWNWVFKLGYQGSLSRNYTIQNNLNWLYPQFLNPRVANLFFYFNDANASYNAMLTELEHRFSNQFQLDFQYRWSHTIDDGSNDYFIGNYPYGNQYLKGDADFDVRHNFKAYGVWSPTIGPPHGWVNRILGGWQITGIWNWHTGYPWTPVFATPGCNAVLPSPYGYCNLQPDNYFGGAGNDTSNSAFQSGPSNVAPSAVNANFPKGALAYFTVPTYAYLANGCGTATGPAPGSFPNFNPLCIGIPPAPSVGRNIFRGPHYFDIDMTLQKSFGLPKLPIFGENARFEFRADFFNLFNILNLGQPNNVISFDGTTSNPQFGQSQGALAGRIIQMQARFSF